MIYEILEDMGYSPTSKNYRQYIEEWKGAYANNIKGFHAYTEYNGRRQVGRTRKTLGMPKKVSEDWADTLVNEDVRITVDEHVDDTIHSVLDDNKFYHRYPELIEKTFALGTGATTQYKDDNGAIKINYIDVDSIFPLQIQNGEIVSCAFASVYSQDVVYLQIHEYVGNGYEIYNKFFQLKEGAKPKEVMVDGVEEVVHSEVRLFQIIKPSIANNIVNNEPLGLSVYANAMDEIMSVDSVYHVLDQEVRVGRMRTYVKDEGLRMEYDFEDEGMPKITPIFNDEQEEFYVLPGTDTFSENGGLVLQVAPTLRTEQHIDALQTQLRMLGRKVGLGDDYYSFKDGSIYTNTTQVISSNSKMYKTRQKHATLVQDAIEELIKAIHYLYYDKIYVGDVTVDFDDSIIEDRAEIERQALIEYNAGLISKVEYFVKTRNMTEEQAVEFVKKQNDFNGYEEEVEFEEG